MIRFGRCAFTNEDSFARFCASDSDIGSAFSLDTYGIKARKDKTVPLEILLYAGNLAVYHSKARKNGQADLYYTQVKYLRRAKNGPKGLVLPTQEKNIFIKLDETKLRRLDELEQARQGI